MKTLFTQVSALPPVSQLARTAQTLSTELFPALVDSWIRESDNPSYTNSSSPPPYTPLPLSGHVTLMYSSSPAKRQVSVVSASHAGGSGEGAGYLPTSPRSDTASCSALDTSARDERRISLASEAERGEIEAAAPGTAAVRTDPCDAGMPSAISQVSEGHSSALEVSPVSGITGDPERPCTVAMMTTNTSVIRPSPIPYQTLQSIALSSSFPSARPPSPYPRTRSLSVQLPPLRTMRHHQPGDEERANTHLSLPVMDRNNAFRLPPLALQRQHSAEQDTSLQRKRKKSRVRSQSCVVHSSGLSSVQEQTVAILQ